MDIEEKLQLITRNTVEVITLDDLKELMERGGRIKGYLGYEPSGLFHIGWMIWAFKVKDLVEAGVDFTLLEATWHAWVNDKMGGDIKRIKETAKYLRHSLRALGIHVEKIRFVDAEELVDDKDYWAIMIKAAKNTTLARARRALTIMGRREKDAEMDTSKLFYPFMQVTDIFYMGIDIALGGMDQRRAHVLARELAEKLGFKKPVGLHTPLLTGLQGTGRAGGGGFKEEDVIEYKMSKSRPETTITIHDEPQEIKQKIMKAYCPPRQVERNPVIEINKYILFSRPGFRMEIRRPEKYGGDITLESYEELESLYREGKIHPADLKNATWRALSEMLGPVRKYFLENKEARFLAERVKNYQMGQS